MGEMWTESRLPMSRREAQLMGAAPIGGRDKRTRLTRADRAYYIAALRSFDILSTCAEDDIRALVKAGEEFVFPPQWAMIAEGTPADYCYAIMRGTARIFRGRDQIATVRSGSLVGEMAVLTGTLRSATVTTETTVTGIGIENERLLTLLARRPSLYAALRRQFVERAAENGRILTPAPLTTRRRSLLPARA